MSAKRYTEKQLAKNIEKHIKQLIAIGATPYESDDSFYKGYFQLNTESGILRICPKGDWFACRFEDVEAAKKNITISTFSLNPFTGKWNWHWMKNTEQYTVNLFFATLETILKKG